MRRFKVYDNYWRRRLLNKQGKLLKPVEENGQLIFSWEEVRCVAKASGLKSKKKRHIIKRFRNIMYEAIDEVLERDGLK